MNCKRKSPGTEIAIKNNIEDFIYKCKIQSKTNEACLTI